MGGAVLSQPAVWTTGGVTRVYVGTANGFVAYQLTCASGGQPSLSHLWQNAVGSNASPLVANGVLYLATSGTLTAADPVSGMVLWSGAIGAVHWESPIVANGVLYMPDDGGLLNAFTVPGPPHPLPRPLPTGPSVGIPAPRPLTPQPSAPVAPGGPPAPLPNRRP